MDEIKAQLSLITVLVESKDSIAATVAAQKLVALLEAQQLKSTNALTKTAASKDGLPTAEAVRVLLDYDAETGDFFWRKKTTPRRMAGATAGTTSKDGYVSIMIGYKAHKAHRLAWLYVNGVWPNGVIDHINGSPGDNRIANLRETSQMSNAQNRKKSNSNSKSGSIGVTPEGDCWRAQITSGGKVISLGVFVALSEAQAAYTKAKERVHAGSNLLARESAGRPCESV